MPAETAKTLVQDGFLRSRGDDRWLAKLADLQYGVVGRGQMLERGLTDEAIGVRLRTGRLHRLHGGVYAVGRRMISREGQWMAAVLASRPEAVLSHWSAAALWMIRPNSRSIIDITTSQKSRSWDGIRRHHKALPTDEVTVEERIPVTTVPRTILDLAATESADVVGNLLRESEYRQLHDRLSLWDLVERTAFREDRARDRALRVAGYSVTRLTWNQLDDEPEVIASDLRALLARSAPASAPLYKRP